MNPYPEPSAPADPSPFARGCAGYRCEYVSEWGGTVVVCERGVGPRLFALLPDEVDLHTRTRTHARLSTSKRREDSCTGVLERPFHLLPDPPAIAQRIGR
jgi:hypothetical protein